MKELTLDLRAGQHISLACQEAVAKARATNKKVVFTFNDVRMVATPRRKPQSMVKEFDRVFDRRRNESLKSPASVLRERKHQANLRKW